MVRRSRPDYCCALVETLMARAIWKGRLLIGDEDLAVKMYSAAQERTVHFRLLDKQTLTPVHQRIVRKSDHQEVANEERLKAVPLGENGRAVLLSADELAGLEPEDTRDITLCRFVAPALLTEQWFEKPYYLGPDKDAKRYFALVQALAKANLYGIARWVMRKKRYVGALTAENGYLMMVRLRRAEQVLAVPKLEPAREPGTKELTLAERLVESVAGHFDPTLWQDEYHERLCQLIAAKASGRVHRLRRPPRTRPKGDLSEQLKQSLAAIKERRVA